MFEQLLAGHREVLEHLQLPDPDLGGRRRDRLAGRWRGDHEPDSDLPLLVRSVCARDGAHLQGREFSPAPGLRDHADALARGTPEQRAMAQDALNRWWWPSIMMFGPSDARLQAHGAVDALEDQALHQRRAAPEVHRYHRAAGGVPRTDDSRSAAALERGERSTTIRHRSTGASSTRCSRATGRATASGWRRAGRRTRTGDWVREAAAAHAREAAGTRRRLAACEHSIEEPTMSNDWPLFEVFIRSRAGLEHKHVGSVHAADAAHGDRACARCLHAAAGGCEHLGRAVERHHRLPIRARRMRCSSRRATRCIAIRRSTRSRTR